MKANYFLRKLLLIVLIFSASGLTTSCTNTRYALKLLEKKKFKPATAILNRSLAKDSINAQAKYVYSLMYTDTAYHQYHIDTAYAYILDAATDLTQPDTAAKQQILLKKLWVDSTTIASQKLRVDSLAFARAAAQHTVESYQYFLDRFSTAAQYDTAVGLRNALAFEKVRQANTYQAYQKFMETYPDAVEFNEAKEHYNMLVFRDKTQAGTLESYLQFLVNFPETPYRTLAEKEIFEISTVENTLESYEVFIRRFPNSIHAKKAIDFLYHLYKTNHNPADFLERYDPLPFADSLREVIALENEILIPFYENKKYGFFDSKGEVVIPTQYDGIAEEYFCHGVTNDFVKTSIASEEGNLSLLLTKDNQRIFGTSVNPDLSVIEAASATLTDLGGGLVEVTNNGQHTLVHKSGLMVLDTPEGGRYEGIELMPVSSSDKEDENHPPYQFIKFQLKGKWGLSTFAGKALLEAVYDDIELMEEFVMLTKNEKIAVTNREALFAKADNQPLPLSFIYEDIAMVDDTHLIAYTERQETVLNDQLQVIVPLADHTIIRPLRTSAQMDKYWLIRKKDASRQYYLFSRNSREAGNTHYEQAYYDDRWLAFKADNKFILFDFYKNRQSTETYDSVKILSKNFVLLFPDFARSPDSVTIVFQNQKKVNVASSDKKQTVFFRLLRPRGMAEGSETSQYLLIDDHSREKQIYNDKGEVVFSSDFDEVSIEAPHLFVIEKNGKKGLIDSLGNTLLSTRYQGIGNYADGILAVLDRGKFGLYKYDTKEHIKPLYDAILKVYYPEADSIEGLFIAKKKGKTGLINAEDKVLIPFDFEEIRYWTDSTALVKDEAFWKIYQFRSQQDTKMAAEEKVLFDKIIDFDYIKSDPREIILRIYQEEGYGILSNLYGEVLGATYDDITLMADRNTGGQKDRIFLAEKYVSEADLYIIIHLDASGNIIRRQALKPEDYDMVFCDRG